jgi:hypothetical protein
VGQSSTPTPKPRELPQVTVGPIDEAAPAPDWRNAPDSDDDDDDTDDAPMLPHDTLTAILGFDPDKYENEDPA